MLEIIANTAGHVSSTWYDANDRLTALTSLALLQADIVFIKSSDGGTATTGAVTTTASSPAAVINGNGIISVPYTASDVNWSHGTRGVIRVSPAAAVPQEFDIVVVSAPYAEQLSDLEDTLGAPAGASLSDDIAAVQSTANDIYVDTQAIDLSDLAMITGSDGAVLASAERATLAAQIEAELVNDGDATALLQAIADKFAAEFDIEDITLAAVSAAVRDAILDRVLAGNHTTPGTPGQILQDVLLDASYTAPLDATETQAAAAAAITEASLPDTTTLNSRTLASASYATATKLLNYFRLSLRNDAEVATDLESELNEINANTGTGEGSYSNESESLQALIDKLNSIDSTLGLGTIAVVSHQAPGGSIVLYQGDTYKVSNNRPLRWVNVDGAGWPPSLENATIKFSAILLGESGDINSVDASKKIVATGTVFNPTGPNQEVRCELEPADTDKVLGVYGYDVEATFATGEVHTLVSTEVPQSTALMASRNARNANKLEILKQYSKPAP